MKVTSRRSKDAVQWPDVNRSTEIRVGAIVKKMSALCRRRNSPNRAASPLSYASALMKKVRIDARKPVMIHKNPTIESLRVLFDSTVRDTIQFYGSWLQSYGMSFADLNDENPSTGPIELKEKSDVVIECIFQGESKPGILYMGLGTREPKGVSENSDIIVSRRKLNSIKRWFSNCPLQCAKRVSDLDRLLRATSTPFPEGKNSHEIKRIACGMILNAAVEEQLCAFRA